MTNHTPPPQIFSNVPMMLAENVVGIMLFCNGLLQTEGFDYARTGSLMTMAVPPVASDLITAGAYRLGLQLGGAHRSRYIAPWPFKVTGDYDGIATLYEISTGPNLSGVADGKNRLFTMGVNLKRQQVWKNGVLQTFGTDYSSGPNAVVFLPGSEPSPGDILTVYGW